MSLLDDVSIVVTPNGYKAGELYAVVPVPTEGAEEVVNGTFLTNTSSGWNDWNNITLPANSSQQDGYGILDATSGTCDARQDVTVEIGKTYLIESTQKEDSGGAGRLYMSDGANYSYAFGSFISTATETTFKQYVVPTQTTIRLYAYNSGSAKAYFTNVSIKEALTVSADMDVTRATAATRVDEAGLVNYAEIIGSEEVTNGDFATDTDWTKGTNWTISGGTASNSGSANFSDLTQNNTDIIISKNYKITYTVSNYASGSFKFIMNNNSASGLERNANGTYTDYVVASSQSYSFRTQGSGFVGSIDNVSVKEVTRDNVPRIDYSGGGCPHILAEPQRTNLITYSEDFTDSSWTKLGGGTGTTAVVTSNYAISPDGTQNATRLVCDLNGGTTTSDQSLIYDLDSSNTSQSISIYMKSNTGSNQNIYFANTYGTGDTAIVTSEWQRFEFNHSTSNHTFSLGLRGNTGADNTADILIWAAQSEAGSYPTSYIPTSGSTVTRNQDQFSREGIGSLINSEEGVLFWEGVGFINGGSEMMLSLSDGTSTNVIQSILHSTASRIIFRIILGGVNTVNLSSFDISQTENLKIALKWRENDFALWINGVEKASLTSGSTFSTNTINQLNFADSNGASKSFLGKVKQLQVYKTALTDEQLIQLTGTSGTDFYESYAEMASALTYTIQ